MYYLVNIICSVEVVVAEESVFTALLKFSKSQEILHSFITAAKERIDVTDLDSGHHLLEKLTGFPSSFNTCQEDCLNQFLMGTA